MTPCTHMLLLDAVLLTILCNCLVAMGVVDIGSWRYRRL